MWAQQYAFIWFGKKKKDYLPTSPPCTFVTWNSMGMLKMTVLSPKLSSKFSGRKLQAHEVQHIALHLYTICGCRVLTAELQKQGSPNFSCPWRVFSGGPPILTEQLNVSLNSYGPLEEGSGLFEPLRIWNQLLMVRAAGCTNHITNEHTLYARFSVAQDCTAWNTSQFHWDRTSLVFWATRRSSLISQIWFHSDLKRI